jgi:hypothetical protein
MPSAQALRTSHPVFAEYSVHTCSDHFRVEWPWRHSRLPLHPRRSIGVGISEGNEIRVERTGQVISRDIEGRRNHRIALSAEGAWQCLDMGHLWIIVDGTRMTMPAAGLRAGSLIDVADGLVFRVELPKTTPLAWAALTEDHHRVLSTLARALPPPAEARSETDRWWPQRPTTDHAVLIDWLLERGLNPDDAEVELAHLLAWHDVRMTKR